uniref:Uncharacterized protein n=1 Tax=Heterorhabditis bacteriophora TaxID=37862 RepID=A0A1I7WVS5_HETBA
MTVLWIHCFGDLKVDGLSRRQWVRAVSSYFISILTVKMAGKTSDGCESIISNTTQNITGKTCELDDLFCNRYTKLNFVKFFLKIKLIYSQISSFSSTDYKNYLHRKRRGYWGQDRNDSTNKRRYYQKGNAFSSGNDRANFSHKFS